ncbi:CHAT domain-containing tetratricopeptide repeat protein [Hyalangium rubrum]|uniref:Tetratricopeptide repeat protein n=1 Tax=Hyalangium rubrum TaxID=3103134 RepID=A0ABU5GW48_9BACT|nr:tetratricopeptide repeat protein [Hyalangium sp. s54d21]MDY7225069.1 tetratricopeptide repeat protein [Hyalangium sp. s54d21]
MKSGIQRTLVRAALVLLSGVACATVDPGGRDPRLTEARQAYEQGQQQKAAGHYAEAVPLLEHALELREAVLGDTHPEVAQCLNLLGAVQVLQGSLARAELLLQRALAIREAAFGERHPEVAESLHTLATVYLKQGQPARAEQLYGRALEIREEVLGKDHPDVASTLNNLGNLYLQQGQFARSEALHERALAVREKSLPRNHPDIAFSLNNLASVHMKQGHYARAESLYGRAIAIKEETLGKNHPDVAQSLNNLANAYVHQGKYPRAEALYQRAIAIWTAAFGDKHPYIADALYNLANLIFYQGRYAQSESLYQRVLAIQEEALGKGHSDLVDVLHGLSLLYMAQGQYERGIPFAMRAIEISKATLGERHPNVALALDGLANLYSSQGGYAQAEPLYEQAVAVREQAFGRDHPDVAESLGNLASAYVSQGHFARAEPLHLRALAIREQALGKNHPNVARSLHHLALLYFNQGQYSRAEPLHQRALEIRETVLGEAHPDVATSLHDLALLRVAQQRLAEALPLFERALAVSEADLRQEVFGFSERGLESFLRLLRKSEEQLYALARAYPDDARVRRLALTAALLRKGRSVEEIADTSQIISRSLGPEDREAFEHLRALRTRIAEASLAGPGTRPPTEYQQLLKDLAAQSDTLEADLARRSASLRAHATRPRPAELVDRVAASLPKDSVLVEFVAYESHAAPALPDLGGPRYLALLLFADGSTQAVDLGLADPLDRASLQLHRVLARHVSAYASAARELYKLAFRPLVPRLGKVRRLFLSTDGQLSLVPFGVLNDGRHMLEDGFELAYLTSGRDLLPRIEEVAPERSVVVLADPDFDAPPAVSPERGDAGARERSGALERFFSAMRAPGVDQPFPPLPGTRKEAEAIQRMFPQAQLFLGRAATKEALLKVRTPGILHIATHGFFREDAPTGVGTRAVGACCALGEEDRSQRLPDPLLRSYLVLAGAHASAAQPGGARREDSLVTALELAGLDLWGTQLVVLSACDTGLGDIKQGQGVYGLRRAFVVAGAEAVVASLWSVNDEKTQEFMESYYRNLLAGQGRVTALREAMRTFRRKHPHPYFWAPFIAMGQDTPLRGLVPRTEPRPAP